MINSPDTIYLQDHDQDTGELLDYVADEITWCRDQINDDDTAYVIQARQEAQQKNCLGILEAELTRLYAAQREAGNKIRQLLHKTNQQEELRGLLLWGYTQDLETENRQLAQELERAQTTIHNLHSALELRR